MKGSRKNVSRETSWMNRPEKEVFLEGAGLLGLKLEPEQIQALLAYLSDLREWNKKIKLIGPAKPAEQVIVHLLDSLIPLTGINREYLDLIDIGSGAGLPGIPLKIGRPGWNVTMVESRDKKAAFIRDAIRTLRLVNARVLTHRISENAPRDLTRRFDLVTFRALGGLKDILPLAEPMVSREGLILAYKGPSYEEDLDEAKGEMDRIELFLKDTRHLRLPFLNHDRFILFFGKK